MLQSSSSSVLESDIYLNYYIYLFLQVEQVRGWLENIKENTLKMRKLQSSILSSPRPDESMF